MAGQQFTVVYDVLNQAYDDRMGLLWATVLLALGSPVVVLLARRYPRKDLRWGFLVAALSCCTLVLGLGTLGAFQERSRCLTWARSGNFEVVEGRVENYKSMPPHGHGKESFTVGGVYFQYSDYETDVNGGFGQTAMLGGPIREGLYVRIRYHEGRILKIEVAEDSGRSLPNIHPSPSAKDSET